MGHPKAPPAALVRPELGPDGHRLQAHSGGPSGGREGGRRRQRGGPAGGRRGPGRARRRGGGPPPRPAEEGRQSLCQGGGRGGHRQGERGPFQLKIGALAEVRTRSGCRNKPGSKAGWTCNCPCGYRAPRAGPSCACSGIRGSLPDAP